MVETTLKDEREFVDLLLVLFQKYSHVENKSTLLRTVFSILETDPQYAPDPREMLNPPNRKNLIAEHRIMQLRASGKTLPEILYDSSSNLTIRRNCIKLMRYETRTF
jgi:hypothetical protein